MIADREIESQESAMRAAELKFGPKASRLAIRRSPGEMGRKAKPIIGLAERAVPEKERPKSASVGFNDLSVAQRNARFPRSHTVRRDSSERRKRGPPPRRCNIIGQRGGGRSVTGVSRRMVAKSKSAPSIHRRGKLRAGMEARRVEEGQEGEGLGGGGGGGGGEGKGGFRECYGTT